MWTFFVDIYSYKLFSYFFFIILPGYTEWGIPFILSFGWDLDIVWFKLGIVRRWACWCRWSESITGEHLFMSSAVVYCVCPRDCVNGCMLRVGRGCISHPRWVLKVVFFSLSLRYIEVGFDFVGAGVALYWTNDGVMILWRGSLQRHRLTNSTSSYKGGAQGGNGKASRGTKVALLPEARVRRRPECSAPYKVLMLR